ncbi:MAG: ParB/RepB/Spo0J family partition protein [Proteobacteria bacterium]|nr:ParB/RepB/Spo0J family partition protein [Cystobacterineae bacterium]MCL2258948.1 ParB/RepB/Spo0J family partition protein [Cystobacterineae bacterium]MCL2314109.1 ParB/RepB/Spo0J family partition protein [Pseudomonadota bacterium]
MNSPSSSDKKRGLGRGLGSLIGAARPEATKAGVLKLPVEQIQPYSHNPRKFFEDSSIDELADSIIQQGLLQPVLVRREGAGFKLIAGERRWRAAQRAGLTEIPALIREVSDEEAFEMALVENLQREDLNPLEEAEGYQRLLVERGWTQEQVAERVGKNRVTVANALRLLQLPEGVRALLAGGQLEVGHARALLGLGEEQEMLVLARHIIGHKLSVRQTEAQVRLRKQAKPRPKAFRFSLSAKKVAEELQRKLGTRVRILEKADGSGKLEIDYFSYEDLERILAGLLQ